MTGVEIRDGAFSDRRTLAKALREARVLPSGGRLLGFRVEGDRVVAFPAASVWHSFIITREPGCFRCREWIRTLLKHGLGEPSEDVHCSSCAERECDVYRALRED
jgi:hypothetical protein